MKRFIKRQIRRLVNWAYGYDILFQNEIMEQRLLNLKITMLDIYTRKKHEKSVKANKNELKEQKKGETL